METHVAIVTDLDDIDMSKGGPKVGKLPLGEDFAEPYPSSAGPYCATLDAADLEPLDQVIVAVHAEVRILMVADDPLTLEDETEYRYESAWAAAAEANEATGQFEGSNWATYVTVTVPPEFTCLIIHRMIGEMGLEENQKVFVSFKPSAINVF